MRVTIALRTNAVLSAVLVHGAVACSYEYDRFKVEPPNANATAGKDGTALAIAGSSGTAANVGNSGRGNGGAKGSEVIGGASGRTSVRDNSGGVSTAPGGFGGAAGALNNSGGRSTTPEATGGRRNTASSSTSGGTTGGTGPGVTTMRSTTGGATGGSPVSTGGTSIRSIGGAHSGGVSATSSGGANSTGAAGASSTCQAPLVDCGGSCVDLTYNPDHCGTCGHACFQASASWAVCVAQRCSCDGGGTLCNAGMVCEKKDVCTTSAK